MKYGKYIISTFLLGIYCLAVFHNFIPHFHVDHDSGEHVHGNFEDQGHHKHGHSHHHSHHEAEATDLAGLDLIFSLFGHLGHSGHADTGEQHLENYSAKVQQRSLTKMLPMTPSMVHAAYSLSPPEFIPPCIGVPPPLPDQIFLTSRSLRGPPSFA